jgi:hypothetical protein
MTDTSTLREASEPNVSTGPSVNGSRGQAIPFFGFLNAGYCSDEQQKDPRTGIIFCIAAAFGK